MTPGEGLGLNLCTPFSFLNTHAHRHKTHPKSAETPREKISDPNFGRARHTDDTPPGGGVGQPQPTHPRTHPLAKHPPLPDRWRGHIRVKRPLRFFGEIQKKQAAQTKTSPLSEATKETPRSWNCRPRIHTTGFSPPTHLPLTGLPVPRSAPPPTQPAGENHFPGGGLPTARGHQRGTRTPTLLPSPGSSLPGPRSRGSWAASQGASPLASAPAGTMR